MKNKNKPKMKSYELNNSQGEVQDKLKFQPTRLERTQKDHILIGAIN